MELNLAKSRSLRRELARFLWAPLILSSLAVGCHYPLTTRDEGGTELPHIGSAEQLASQGLVKTLAFSRGGRTLVVGGELVNGSAQSNSVAHGFVQVWDLEGNNHLDVTLTYPRSVTALAVSPDGSKWVAGDAEGRLILSTTRAVPKPFHQKAEITSLAFSPDGKWVASGSADSKFPLGFLDMFTGGVIKVKASFEPVSSLAFSSDGKEVAVGMSTGRLVVWNFTSDSGPMQIVPGINEKHAITSVTFSSDGSLLAYGHREGKMVILDRRSGQQVMVFERGSSVSALAFSPDSRYLAVGLDSGEVVLIDCKEIQLVWSKRHFLSVSDLAYSPDGTSLAVAAQLSVFLYKTGEASRADLRQAETSGGMKTDSPSKAQSPGGHPVTSQ